MFLEPLGRVLRYQLKESGQTKLYAHMHAHMRMKSNAGCEILIVAFYIRAGQLWSASSTLL